MSDPVVSIVIPTWNQSKLTYNCIQSIKSWTRKPHQIVLVDNGSVDNTVDLIPPELDQNDIYLRNPVNRGFAKANNQGLAVADGEYVLFLNNDTIVQESTWVGKLLTGIEKADLVGPNLCRVNPCGVRKLFFFEGEGSPEDKWHYIEGWCLFGRKETFLSIDGWCEDFFPTYCDDTDLSFRARVAGLKLKKVPVPILHLGNQAFPLYGKYMETNGNQISLDNGRKLYKKWVEDWKGSF